LVRFLLLCNNSFCSHKKIKIIFTCFGDESAPSAHRVIQKLFSGDKKSDENIGHLFSRKAYLFILFYQPFYKICTILYIPGGRPKIKMLISSYLTIFYIYVYTFQGLFSLNYLLPLDKFSYLYCQRFREFL